jgi:hypothetical protein
MSFKDIIHIIEGYIPVPCPLRVEYDGGRELTITVRLFANLQTAAAGEPDLMFQPFTGYTILHGIIDTF